MRGKHNDEVPQISPMGMAIDMLVQPCRLQASPAANIDLLDMDDEPARPPWPLGGRPDVGISHPPDPKHQLETLRSLELLWFARGSLE